MAGIYIHIPFCKQACHYCDFHFSTTLKNKQQLVNALCKELAMRKKELVGEIETIYFGGGTPSLLSEAELNTIFETIYANFSVSKGAEITLEANPDDLSPTKLIDLSKSPINRLSIGVQSFFEEDLKLMNRAHNASEAWETVLKAKEYFKNISIDLIYGIPEMTNDRWLQNLEKAFSLEVPHLSCYALTVEPKTALKSFIEKGIIPAVEDEVAQEHHKLLVEETEKRGFINYEFSNFGKLGLESKNNLGYWLGKPYLGIGPSAHSYDGNSRSWNIANNSKYMKAIETNKLPIDREKLTKNDKYNEYVMTRLRTKWGINLMEVETLFGTQRKDFLMEQAQMHLKNHLLSLEGQSILVTKKGKFLSDGIASDLFLLNLD